MILKRFNEKFRSQMSKVVDDILCVLVATRVIVSDGILLFDFRPA